MLLRRSALFFSALASLGAAAFAQSPRVYTAQDYHNAERWMAYNTLPLVSHTISGITYLPDGRVFYRDPTATATVYKIADPVSGKTVVAFDNVKLGAALGKASEYEVDPNHLGISNYKPRPDESFLVELYDVTFDCNAAATVCRKASIEKVQQPTQQPNGQPPAAGVSATQAGGNAQMSVTPNDRTATQGVATKPGATRSVKPAISRSKAPFDLSPDKTHSAFIRDWNLWIREEATGEERQLTTDGVPDFGYATDNAGWQHSEAPILVWSPDSKKIATFQQDERKDGYMYLVPVTNRHPQLERWHYPFLGDKEVTMIQPVVIDVSSAKVTRLKMEPEYHRSTLCDDVSCRGGAGWDDAQFSPDGTHLALVSSSRDHKDATLRVADTEIGDVRTVYHEHMPTYFESGIEKVNWRYLPESNEFLWFSQRSDWGQMYLYDLTTGKLKQGITHGEGTVTQVLHVDAKARVLYFLATGKEAGQDPYYTHFYRVNFDGTGQHLLTPEIADHAITTAPDGKTFVDVYSTLTTPRVAVLRDNEGKVITELAKQNIAPLIAAGWKPAMPINVKARDGKTPLYGFLWRPTNFDASKKYPVVDYVYPGPFTGSCGSRSFSPSHGDDQALADLGFVVVCIDGMGTPFRSKSFQDAHADTPAGLAEDTIPDQVSGIRDLAKQYPWIDSSRVGIWGHSGGGNATVSAMFHFPDFFKVGIAESGNHDNREYEDDWDEKYGGLEVIGKDGKSNYDVQANQNFAANLKGHLLLAHGTMDDNVPMNNTLLVVDALIKANKDFDLIMVPNAHHGYGAASYYMTRRRWDYFVRNLAGDVPPMNYQMKNYEAAARAIYADGPSAATEGSADADEME
ncbi:MAG: DPP IV N-terminal domain-containing protein [Janthinobacterium lividum]